MIRESHYTDGVSCDSPYCTASIQGNELPIWPGLNRYQEEAVAQGWTYWAGRTNRQYCPDHRPKPGHKMRLVAGVLAGGGSRD